jgi:hypothetical protein
LIEKALAYGTIRSPYHIDEKDTSQAIQIIYEELNNTRARLNEHTLQINNQAMPLIKNLFVLDNDYRRPSPVDNIDRSVYIKYPLLALKRGYIYTIETPSLTNTIIENLSKNTRWYDYAIDYSIPILSAMCEGILDTAITFIVDTISNKLTGTMVSKWLKPVMTPLIKPISKYTTAVLLAASLTTCNAYLHPESNKVYNFARNYVNIIYKK